MSKKQKEVKVGFHTLIQKHYKKKDEELGQANPFREIDELLISIFRLPKLKRFYDLKDNKFCFIENIEIIKKEDIKLVTGFIKSARNEFRPNLIDKRTGNERQNPKSLSEGDIEKTHFCFRVDETDVYIFLQDNYHGVSINSFINYLKHFERGRLDKKKLPMNFTLTYSDIMRNNFLTELELMSRVKSTEVFIEKKFLGSDSLNLSNRTQSVQKEIKLVVNANIRENIKNFAVDVFNRLNSGKDKSITKIRVMGNDENENDVVIDTSYFNKVEYINVDLNPETGEVNTTQMITGLKRIANSY
jgi:hypothetical protein